MPSPNSKAARQLASLLRATKPGPQQPASSPQQQPASEAVKPAPAEQQLPPSESAESCSNLLTASKKIKCAANKKDGAHDARLARLPSNTGQLRSDE
jgi:hypothetical protein